MCGGVCGRQSKPSQGLRIPTTRATDFGEASRMLLFISKGKLARKSKNTAKASKMDVSGKILKIFAGYRMLILVGNQ